jgi:hypothetical protein
LCDWRPGQGHSHYFRRRQSNNLRRSISGLEDWIRLP